MLRLPVTHPDTLQWPVIGKLHKTESIPSLQPVCSVTCLLYQITAAFCNAPQRWPLQTSPKSLLSIVKKTTRGADVSAFLCLVKSFHFVLWVLHSITKTLEAAYLLKTGGRERVKKVSQSSIFFLVHRVGLLKPPELRFLPPEFSPSTIPASLIHLGPRNLHWFWLARFPNLHRRTLEKSIIFAALQKNPSIKNTKCD